MQIIRDESGEKKVTLKCAKCNKWVQVIVNPQPNEINIGGPAVATNCIS